MENTKDFSSSDEEDARLREALDPQMFGNEKAITDKNEPEEFKVSSYRDNILNVTPEFQSYVAKHLTDMLEKTIEEYEPMETQSECQRTGGIKLFVTSDEIVTEENFQEYCHYTSNPNTRKRKYHSVRQSEDDTPPKEKIRLAAVSPEWVLEKRGISGWSKPKGKEINVKKNASGELEVVNPPFISY